MLGKYRRGGHAAEFRLVDLEVGVFSRLPRSVGEFLGQLHGVGFPTGMEAGGSMAAHFPLHGAAGSGHHVFQRADLRVEIFVGFQTGLGGWKPPPRLFSQPPTIRPHSLSWRALNSNCLGASSFRSLAMRTTQRVISMPSFAWISSAVLFLA